MVIVYNPIGLLMCFTPVVISAFVTIYHPIVPDDWWALLGIWSVVAFVWDSLYRVFNRDVVWYSPCRGGHIFFVPVCVFSLIGLIWYVHRALHAGYWLPQFVPKGQPSLF
jgi:hypothetical protein